MNDIRAAMLVWIPVLLLVGAVVLFHDKPLFWTLSILGGVLICGIVAWQKGFADDEEMWPQFKRTTAPAVPAPGTEPNTNKGITDMIILRGLGYLWTILAALAWALTFFVSAFIYLYPPARAIIVPYIGETVFQLFLAFGNIGGIALVVLNGLSGRWGPESLRRWDLLASRWFGVVGMSVIAFLVFVVGVGRDGLPSGATTFLVAITAFGWYDYFVNQGEDWRSSRMRGLAPAIPPTAGASSGSSSAKQVPLTGLLANFVPLGLTRILLENERVIIDVDQGGGFSYDLPDMNQARLTQLAAEAVSAQHQGPAPQVPQGPAPAVAP